MKINKEEKRYLKKLLKEEYKGVRACFKQDKWVIKEGVENWYIVGSVRYKEFMKKVKRTAKEYPLLKSLIMRLN